MSTKIPLSVELSPWKPELVDRCIEIFQPMSDEPFPEDMARESLTNLVGAFSILLEAKATSDGDEDSAEIYRQVQRRLHVGGLGRHKAGH